MRTFQQNTNDRVKEGYIDHFLDWSSSTHNAKYITGTVTSQEFTDILTGGKNVLADFTRIIDNFLNVSAEKKQLFYEMGPMKVTAENPDEDLRHLYRLFKIYWLGKNIDRNGITSPVQLLSFGFPTVNCHPGSDKRHAIMFLAKPTTVPFVYIDYKGCDYKFYEQWDNWWECTTREQIIAAFPNFYHRTHHCVYEWIDMWKSGCSSHNTPVHNGIKKYHKKATQEWNYWRTRIGVWHLSYYDAIHRHGMNDDRDMLWDIQLQDTRTLWIGDQRFEKISGVWTPDNGNFDSYAKPLNPIDKYTAYSACWV